MKFVTKNSIAVVSFLNLLFIPTSHANRDTDHLKTLTEAAAHVEAFPAPISAHLSHEDDSLLHDDSLLPESDDALAMALAAQGILDLRTALSASPMDDLASRPTSPVRPSGCFSSAASAPASSALMELESEAIQLDAEQETLDQKNTDHVYSLVSRFHTFNSQPRPDFSAAEHRIVPYPAFGGDYSEEETKWKNAFKADLDRLPLDIIAAKNAILAQQAGEGGQKGLLQYLRIKLDLMLASLTLTAAEYHVHYLERAGGMEPDKLRQVMDGARFERQRHELVRRREAIAFTLATSSRLITAVDKAVSTLRNPHEFAGYIREARGANSFGAFTAIKTERDQLVEHWKGINNRFHQMPNSSRPASSQ